MSRAAFSAKVFAVYLSILGSLLTLVPNAVLPLFGLAPTTEVWVRIVGLIAFNLGIYVWVAARHEDRPFLEASVTTRGLVFCGLAGFALAGMAGPAIALFGVIDLCGAIWTCLALQADARAAARPGVSGSAA